MNILLKNSIGKISAVEFVFIAFLTVATQLQSKDLMQMIIGQTLQGEIFVVATAFTGFLIGLSIHLNRHLKMFLYGLAAVFQLVLCLYYDFIAEQSLISSWFGIVVFAMCTVSIVLAAIILAEFLYNPKFDLSRYIQIQKFAFYSAAAILFLTFFADKQIVYFFMALSFFSAALRSSQVKPKQIRQPLKLNRNSFEATVWGFASGCATNYFFNFYHSMVYPTGLEFYFYILILFLYLYVSGLILKKHNFKIKLFEGYVAAAAILFIATTIVVLTNLNGKFYFDPLQLTTSLVFSYYPFFIFFILLILMSPYLIISFTVPVLQSENENVNYMFFTTLGSCLIQYIFLIPIFNISLHGRFFFLVGFLLMAYFLHSKNQKKRWSLGLCSLILIGLASLSWPELESRLVVQARRFHDAYWIPVEFRRRMIQLGNSFNEVDILKRVGGKIGALGGHQPNLKMLTLDGYSAETYLPHDYIKAAISAEVVTKRKPNRILLLGLGNHIVLQKLLQVKSAGAKIDVVDNSIFFSDPLFLKTVAADAGFSWPADLIELHIEDALHFMYRTDNRYDLIIWNLTLPNYIDSLPLFSSQFAVQMRNHLNSEGTLILPFYQNSHFDCVSADLYRDVKIFKTAKPLSLAIFEAGHLPVSPEMRVFSKYCERSGQISLASQFQDRSFNLQTIRQQVLPPEFSKLFVKSEDIEPLKNFNQSTILETDNEKPSLIFNVPLRIFDQNANLNFKESMRGQKFFSIGWLDNYAQQKEFFKLSSMFNYFLKDKSTVVQIPPDFTLRAPQLRKALNSYELRLDDVSFWQKVSGKMKGESVFFLEGNTFLATHIREVIERNKFGSVKQGSTFAGKKTIIFAVSGNDELEQLIRKYEKVSSDLNVQFVVWFPPWIDVSVRTRLKIASQIRWRPAACSGHFWKNLIEQIHLNQPLESGHSALIRVSPATDVSTASDCKDGIKIQFE